MKGLKNGNMGDCAKTIHGTVSGIYVCVIGRQKNA